MRIVALALGLLIGAAALASCTTAPPGTVAPGTAWFAMDGDAASGLSAYAFTSGAGDPFGIYITYVGVAPGSSAHQLQVNLQPGAVGTFSIEPPDPALPPPVVNLQVRFKNWKGTYDCDEGIDGAFYITQYSATAGAEIAGELVGRVQCTLTPPTGPSSVETVMITGRFSATVQ